MAINVVVLLEMLLNELEGLAVMVLDDEDVVEVADEARTSLDDGADDGDPDGADEDCTTSHVEVAESCADEIDSDALDPTPEPSPRMGVASVQVVAIDRVGSALAKVITKQQAINVLELAEAAEKGRQSALGRQRCNAEKWPHASSWDPLVS